MTAGLATAAIGNGLAFVVLVYATAGISGGHLNPAISTAFVVTGRGQCLAPTPRPPVSCGACLRVCPRRRPALRVLTVAPPATGWGSNDTRATVRRK